MSAHSACVVLCFGNPTCIANCATTRDQCLADCAEDEVCRIPAYDCPNPTDGGHYGALNMPEEQFGGDNLIELLGFQTVRVEPGKDYTFSGEFAGSGENRVRIRLLDGDELGTELASTTVYNGGGPYGWEYAEVTATAVSNVMTVLWQMDNASVINPQSDPHVAHADGLTFEKLICGNPFVDVDEDGDGDQNDFAILQQCITGPGGGVPSTPETCICFDVSGGAADGDIDQDDAEAFAICAAGPDVIYDPQNLPASCTP
jgi:hypothetical protein